MIKMPRTTYSFNAYTYDEDTTDTTDVKLEWTTQEETLQELCDKFANFLRVGGFSYVTNITYETEGDARSDYDNEDEWSPFVDDELDWTSKQPELDEVDNRQFELDFGEPKYYGDIKVSYNSIDDASPEEWNAASRSVWENKNTKINYPLQGTFA